MGTGWRRAFCTTIPRDSDTTSISDKQQTSPSPRSCTKLGFLGGGSNPSTPRSSLFSQTHPVISCRTAALESNESPRLHCKTTTPKSAKSSNPSSPRSPLKLSLFKNSFKFRSSCGICLNSVKTGQGTAIYTAECSHAFHFPCIATYVRKQGSLVCPVCSATWKDVPLLAIHKNLHQENDAVDNTNADLHTITKSKVEEKEKKVVIIESSPRAIKSTIHEPQQQLPHTPKISDSRSYDDDEPLLSPTAGARFIPIPEANENANEEDEDDVEEFQGFFVNPTPSSLEVPFSGTKDSRNVQVRLLPEAAVVSAGRGYETYAVALIVKAPPPPPPQHFRNSSILNPSHRAPVDLVTVLDVSGSMTGAKLQMLKRAMRLVISSLGSADRLSIVAFCSNPKRLFPLRRMTAHGQRAAHRIVDRLVCGQGSSVGEALRKATKVLEDRRERNPVASIMLLSDGQDERVHGNSNNQRLSSGHVSSTRFAHIEIPVHAFGFGQSGGYSYEPAEDAFAKCVGGLLSVVVQDLRVQLSFASGSAPAEILAVYTCNARPTVLSSGSVRLGDLYAEEERELLVELRVPSSAVGAHHVMSVRCLYKDPASQEVVYGRDQALLVPRPHAVRSSAPKIERLRNHFITTRAIAEGRRLVEHGDFTSAHHLLASSRALLLQSSCVSSDEYVRSLEVEMAELQWRKQQQVELPHHQIQRRRGESTMVVIDENGEPLTPTSAWRAAEKLAKVAMMKKSLNKVSDLHGFENARF
ncbi:Zinc finger (C3HC4-type RING finger) family protein [Euphorbia peplus]|nr:Zinc finger (C3HC4-type RING finger) family protein [Euphorbia peplus]